MAEHSRSASRRPLPPDSGAGLRDDESTFSLIARARAGEAQALDQLFARHRKPLQRWASGRLPRWARDISDTEDLVQETLLSTFKRIEVFEPRRVGALQAYLRQALLNRIREELRSKLAPVARSTSSGTPHGASGATHTARGRTFVAERSIVSYPIPDGLEARLPTKLTDWRELLRRNVAEGRGVLRQLLIGPLRFTPLNEGTRRAVSANGSSATAAARARQRGMMELAGASVAPVGP